MAGESTGTKTYRLRAGRGGEALVQRYTGDPYDFIVSFDDGKRAAQGAWHLAVGEEVLEGLGAAHALRALLA